MKVRAAKVEISVFKARLLSGVAVFRNLKRRGFAFVQDLKLPDLKLYLARWNIAVF